MVRERAVPGDLSLQGRGVVISRIDGRAKHAGEAVALAW